jgi:endonuclease YncB( thermonuclease family)
MLRCRPVLVLVLILAAALPAGAETLRGKARVVDGDTIEVAGETIRLFGIDAPELDQPCETDAGRWACGDWARDALSERLRGQQVTCTAQERDRYGRWLAVCELDGQDLNQALVRDGAATAYRRYSRDYVPDEATAAGEGRGIWAGSLEEPEAFRHQDDPEPTVAEAPGGCVLKGNISAGGKRIFHSPGQHDYDATRIDPAKGERWFCSAAEARAAGWRAAAR